MKKVKGLILKGMIAGMTMASGIGVVAPAMACMPVMAAEKTEVNVEMYQHIEESEALSMIEAAKSQGTVTMIDGNTTVIEMDDVKYAYIYYQTDVEEVCFDKYFFLYEPSAVEYANNQGWKNAYAKKANVEEGGPSCYVYYAAGEIQYGTLMVAKTV